MDESKPLYPTDEAAWLESASECEEWHDTLIEKRREAAKRFIVGIGDAVWLFPNEIPWRGVAKERESDEEGHYHECQQCENVVGELCHCAKGNTYMTWCSSNCRAAYDL